MVLAKICFCSNNASWAGIPDLPATLHSRRGLGMVIYGSNYKTNWNEWQVLLFLDYWFCSDMLLRNSLSSGISLLIFVFQSLTMISIFLTIKKGGFSSRLKILAPFLLSIGVLFFCLLGIRAQSLSGFLQSQPFIGFWFALLSSLLFMLSFIFYKRDTN